MKFTIVHYSLGFNDKKNQIFIFLNEIMRENVRVTNLRFH